MGLGRYVVDAITLEGRSPRKLARSHGVSRSWIYELLQRYRQGGYAALDAAPGRPARESLPGVTASDAR